MQCWPQASPAGALHEAALCTSCCSCPRPFILLCASVTGVWLTRAPDRNKEKGFWLLVSERYHHDEKIGVDLSMMAGTNATRVADRKQGEARTQSRHFFQSLPLLRSAPPPTGSPAFRPMPPTLQTSAQDGSLWDA